MMQVVLPWPPKELSPNARQHWARHFKAKKAYRTECYMQARIAGVTTQSLAGAPKAHVSLTFYPPDRRARDADNMIAAMKSGLDGLADALGLDDRHFRITFDVAPTIGGMVKVQIQPLTEA